MTITIVFAAAAVIFAGARIAPVLMKKPDTDTPAPIAAAAPLYATTQPATSQPAMLNRLHVQPAVDDPKADGWDTEVFSQRANAQLKVLIKLLEKPELIDEAHLAPLVTDGVYCDDLVPDSLSEAYDHMGLTVHRAALDETTPGQGAAAMTEALKELAALFSGAREVRGAIKLFNIDKTDTGADTRQYFSFFGRFDDHSLEVNATWTSQWRQDRPGDPPRLEAIQLVAYETARQNGPPATLFSDVTVSAMSANVSFERIHMPSVNHWTPRLEAPLAIEHHALNGVAVGDVNGDGLDDLYFVNTGGIPNALFAQNADGTVTDISKGSGADWMERCEDALLLDLDNDGDQDLVVTLPPLVIVMANDGTGKFQVAARLNTKQNMCTLSAVDYNLDGKLDIYVAIRHPAFDSKGSVIPYPYYDANNGGRNFMYRNDGDWQFTDVTRAIGLELNNTRYSNASAWDDYDNDGDLDLYVANDFGRNNLYRNDGGQFTDVTVEADVEDRATGMGVTWGDYNRDGLMDIYVSNMFSSAGSRITGKDQFKTGLNAKARAYFQRLARGNTLYENLGDGRFRDISVAAGVTMGRWAWSSQFVDVNNDGLEDLVIGNGFITNEVSDDL